MTTIWEHVPMKNSLTNSFAKWCNPTRTASVPFSFPGSFLYLEKGKERTLGTRLRAHCRHWLAAKMEPVHRLVTGIPVKKELTTVNKNFINSMQTWFFWSANLILSVQPWFFWNANLIHPMQTWFHKTQTWIPRNKNLSQFQKTKIWIPQNEFELHKTQTWFFRCKLESHKSQTWLPQNEKLILWKMEPESIKI